MTTDEIKERERQSWGGASPVWKREDAWLTGNTRPVSDRMITTAAIVVGQRVLDVACGTGEPALPIARVVGAKGEVVATDFSREMLAYAEEKAASEGVKNIRFRVVDGESLEGVSGPFDAATIRWGIMFMPDPVGCLRSVRALLKPGGRLAVATWGPPPANPFISLIMGVLRRHFEVPIPPPGSPGIFAFADEARLRSVFTDAGFHDVKAEAFSFHMTYRDPQHFFDIQTGVAAPIRDLLAMQTDAKRDEVHREVLVEAAKFKTANGLEFPAMSWLASGAA